MDYWNSREYFSFLSHTDWLTVMAVFLPSDQITALHARHKRTLFCWELLLVSLSCSQFVFKINDQPQRTVESKRIKVDTGATSHVIRDIERFKDFDDSFQPDNHFIELADSSKTNGVALKRGDAEICQVNANGNMESVTLKGSLRSDNRSEFKWNDFQRLLCDNSIRHETSAPYLPDQNGTAERIWWTLFEMARCMVIENNLPKSLWTYTVMTAAVIRNRCFNNCLKQTPYYMITGRKPDLSKMNIFESTCHAYKNLKKLDPKCEKGIFVGYDRNSTSYLVFYPENNSVLKH